MTVTMTVSHRVIRLNRIVLYQITESHSVILVRPHSVSPINVLTLVLQTVQKNKRKKRIETNYDGMAFEILCIIISTTISFPSGNIPFWFCFLCQMPQKHPPPLPPKTTLSLSLCIWYRFYLYTKDRKKERNVYVFCLFVWKCTRRWMNDLIH